MAANEVVIKLRVDGNDVTVNGLRRVSGELSGMGDAARRSLADVAHLGGAFAVFSGALAPLRGIVQQLDQFSTAASRIGLVSTSLQSAAHAQGELFKIAQQARVGYAGLAETYSMLARSGADLGVSQARLLVVTKSISQAMTISGGSAESMRAALVQLSQGLASGTLRGEELNSILEQTPRLAQAIADGMGKGVGELRKLGEAGKLTSEEIIKALESQAPRLQQEFAKMTPTISGAFQTLKDAAGKAFYEFDKGAGLTRDAAAAMTSLADSLSKAAGGAHKFGEEYGPAIKTVGEVGAFLLAAAAGEKLLKILGGIAAYAKNPLTIAVALTVAGFEGAKALTGSRAFLEAQLSGAEKDLAELQGVKQRGVRAGEEVIFANLDRRIAQAQARVDDLRRGLEAASKRSAEFLAQQRQIDAAGNFRAQEARDQNAATNSSAPFPGAKSLEDVRKYVKTALSIQEDYTEKSVELGRSYANAIAKAGTVGEKNSLALRLADEIKALRHAEQAALAGLHKDDNAKIKAGVSEAIAEYDRLAKALESLQLQAESADLGLSPDTVNNLEQLDELWERGWLSSVEEYDRLLGVILDKEPKFRQEQSEIDRVQKGRVPTLAQLAKAAQSEAQSLEERAAAAEYELAKIGLTEEGLAELTRRRYDEIIAQKQAQLTTARSEAGREGEAAAIEKQIAALGRLRDAEIAGPKLEAQAREWEKFSGDIERALTDSLFRAFEAGEDFGAAFAKSLEATFKSMVLKFVVQAIVQASGVNAALQYVGGGGGEGGFSVGGLANAWSTGSGLYQGYLGYTTGTGTGVLGWAGNQVGALAGPGLGGWAAGTGYTAAELSAMGPFAAKLAPAASGSGAAASGWGGLAGGAAAVGYAAIFYALMTYLDSKAGGVKIEGDAFSTLTPTGSTLAERGAGGRDIFSGNSGIAWVDAAGNPVSHGSYMIPGNETVGGFDIGYHTVTRTVRDQLGELLTPFGASVRDFVAGLGGDATGIGFGLGYAHDPQGSAGSMIGGHVYDASGNLVYSHNFKAGANFGADLNTETKRMMLAGVDASDVAQIFKDYIDTDALGAMSDEDLDKLMGTILGVDKLVKTFDALGLSGKNVSKVLIDMMGGLDAAGQKLATYYQTYFTDAERGAALGKQLNKSFTDLGLTMPTTKAGFRQLVESLDLTTESGRKAFTTLMDLSPTFALYADSATKAAHDAAKAWAGFDAAGLGKMMLDAAFNPQAGMNAAESFSAALSASVRNALINSTIGSIAESIYNAVIVPLVAGEAVAEATTTAIVESAKKKITALNVLFNSPEFAGLLTTISTTVGSLLPSLSQFYTTASSYTATATQTGVDSVAAAATNLQDILENLAKGIRDANAAAEQYASGGLTRYAQAMLDIDAQADDYRKQLLATSQGQSLADGVARAREHPEWYAAFGYEQQMADFLAPVNEWLAAQRRLLDAQMGAEAADLLAGLALQLEDIGKSPAELALLRINRQADEFVASLQDMGQATAENIASVDAWEAAMIDAQELEEIRRGWQSVGDSIFDTIRRLRGELTEGPGGFAKAQADFTLAAAAARAGDQAAAARLPSLAEALIDMGRDMAGSRVEQTLLTARTLGTLESVLRGMEQYGIDIPAFATGGAHAGGLRLVGERGPELEVTGPARIFSFDQARNLLHGEDLAAELRAVRAELAALRAENGAENRAVASATAKTARLLERVMPDGDAFSVRTAT